MSCVQSEEEFVITYPHFGHLSGHGNASHYLLTKSVSIGLCRI